MHGCAAALDSAYYFETGIAGYFTHGTDGTARLLEQDVHFFSNSFLSIF